MSIKIAALQMVSTPDVGRNLDAAAALIADAAAAGAALVALPEYFCLLGRRDTDKLAIAEAPGRGPIQEFLAAAARRHGLFILGGTLPVSAALPARPGAGEPAPAGARVLNRSCLYTPAGTVAAHYDKVHLFAFDNGRESYDEGRTLAAGSEPVAADLELPAWGAAPLRLGLSVCYDLRFPELYRALMRPPCDVIAVPSAFTHTTGLAHWEVLLRARAIENQCYVLAAAQGGTHENGRRTFGHSLIVDPWGEVLACREEGTGVVLAEIDPQRLAHVRRQLPALQHRRVG
ncbi:MAG: carbon-nitrogen hydrolase family protein [Burkholderiales bacterium]|nr:carbon-nitrogen hydrolase family protein [Burkholderiales bacterium]